MKRTKEQKGITLIALIITIVILLILAVVTINAIKGNGIIDYARKARDDYNDKKGKEETQLQNYLDVINANNQGQDTGDDLNHKGIIPEGGTYISLEDLSPLVCQYCETTPGNENGPMGPLWCECGYVRISESAVVNYGVKYEAGQNFPTTVRVGDIYIYGDYKYSYDNPICSYDTLSAFLNGVFYKYNGWGCVVIDKNKTSYEPLLESINGLGLKDITGCFEKCTLLETAPTIPNSITAMTYAFGDCTSLAGSITINADPDSYQGCLYNTKITSVVGDTTMANNILKTVTEL